jgi:TonB-linked SusC/RagA family outer membrane protein
MNNYKYCFIILLLLFASIAHAQQQIAGAVKDKNGPVIGVSVYEKGFTTNGTATDADGRFKLTLKGKSNTVIFSAIGYVTNEVKVNGAALNVLLEIDAKGLGEVVVVGFGKQKKITLTGAVSTVTGKEIRQNPSASLQNTLSGRMPGFYSQQQSGRPGADGAAFYIRGVSSYNGGSTNNPLIIVDDIEFTYDQFARLDPNEIESISILKDASTTAIYGVKGANGVLVITTRRGKAGPPQISAHVETSLMQPTRIPNYLNAYQSASLYNQSQINDNNNLASPDPNFKPMFSDEDLELYRNGKDPYGHPDVNWKKMLFRDFSRQTRGNVDITGGTDNVKYFVSVGYLFQDGMLKNYSKGQDVNNNYYHKRYNYRSNLDMKVTKTLDLKIDLYGNIGEVNVPSIGSPWGYNDIFYDYSSFLTLAPFSYPVYNPDGSFGYSKWQRQVAGGGNYNTNNIIGRLTYYGYTREFENNMNLVTSATQKLDFITQGLSLKGTVSYASNYKYSRNMTRNSFPSFIYDPATETYEARDANVFRVRRFFMDYLSGSTYRNVNMQGMLNYDRTFGNHHVYGLALANQNTIIQYAGDITYNFVPSNFRGFTGRAGYDFKQKYLFEFNSAYNGSDRFVKGRRFGFFPAVSAGWNISAEPFFKDNIKAVDLLKIRGSYGLVGNDKLDDSFKYYYQQTYSRTNGTGGGTSFGYSDNSTGGIQEGTLSNNMVTWEKEKKLDLGIDFSLFKGNLTGTLDYFDNNRYDILTTRGTVSAVFGQGLPPVNLGRVNNRGYEVELNYRGNFTKDVSFSVRGTYSFAKNKILFRDEPTPQYSYQAYTGKSIGQIRVYEWIGFYKDKDDIAKSPKTSTPARPGDLKYKDVNGDGKIDEFDMVVTGFPNLPNTNAGLQLGFNWKGLGLNVLFQGAKNFNVRATAEAIVAFGSNLQEIHLKSWTPELGDNAQYPVLSQNGGVSNPSGYPSTFWFITGDYIRVKTAELSYSLPAKVVKKMRLQDIRVYTNGNNLFTWSRLDKRYEFDPEIQSNKDRSNYPPQRMYNFGLSATF